jgi:hypothetical protein
MPQWDELKTIVEVLENFQQMTLQGLACKTPSISHIREYLEIIRFGMLTARKNDNNVLKGIRKGWQKSFDNKFQNYVSEGSFLFVT